MDEFESLVKRVRERRPSKHFHTDMEVLEEEQVRLLNLSKIPHEEFKNDPETLELLKDLPLLNKYLT